MIPYSLCVENSKVYLSFRCDIDTFRIIPSPVKVPLLYLIYLIVRQKKVYCIHITIMIQMSHVSCGFHRLLHVAIERV